MKLTLLLLSLLSTLSFAATQRYRVVWEDKPHNEAKIVFELVSGSNPVVHYGKLDHGQNAALYPSTATPYSTLYYKSMDNQFVKLSNLDPDTNYYFVIKDSNSTSQRFFFRTAPNVKKPFKYIQGGDSRNNRDVRQDGNVIVSKLRPLFVSFGGDMTDSGSTSEWQNWFDDWQLTIAADGRITPIVPARGNHESSNHVPNLFGVANNDVYFKTPIAGGLFCQYTLNSEIDQFGAQKAWLESDLQATSGQYDFLSASYHKPMRPHVSSKSEGDSEYNAWASVFWDHRFDLIC